MNKFALILVSLFILIELTFGEIVIEGVPVWLIGLFSFSLIWIVTIWIKDDIIISDSNKL